jgi:guanylate kinase
MLEPRVIVISSVSGGGKTSIIRLLRRMHPDLHVAITGTSRPPRPGEAHGVDYYFFESAEFEKMILSDKFLEHALVHGNYYGVPAAQVNEMLAAGRSVILNIDVQGMRSVKRKLGSQVISFFILPPGVQEWEERLRNRRTDSEESIARRLNEGRHEMACAAEYDYRIINHILEDAAGEISAILSQENVLLKSP